MSRIRTGIISLVTAAATTASAGTDIGDPLRHFASCAGRLSAQMEHEWLLNDPASDTTESYRALMIELIDAIMDPDDGRDVLNWRVDAKIAHAALLTRATFQADRWASNRAQDMVNDCTALLIS